jgi:LysM repeat protein
MTYTVQVGDDLISIAEKFALRPSTIMWANILTLRDDPHLLKTGQILNILPANGAYYQWNPGEGLDVVAESYHVTPDNIIKWMGNHISINEIGSITNPNLKPGTWLFIPAGTRPYTTQGIPFIPRTETKNGKALGTNICDVVKGGPLGTGTLIWPTKAHYVSGYPFAPDANHNGIDIAGKLGDAVSAVDYGVVVYSGTSGRFGNIVIIDHGNGWQSIYAFLNTISSGCGQYVSPGDVIGTVGGADDAVSPTLHFEYMSDKGNVDPLNFLPK